MMTRGGASAALSIKENRTMPFRFYRRFRLFPGARFNVSKRGASVNVGRTGASKQTYTLNRSNGTMSRAYDLSRL
jgi:hypothetical protein